MTPEHVTLLEAIARWLDEKLAPCEPHTVEDAIDYAVGITLRQHPSIQAVIEAGWKETDRA